MVTINMEFCEYCGSDTELTGTKNFEMSDGVMVKEEYHKCPNCHYRFYVMKENKDMEKEDGKLN